MAHTRAFLRTIFSDIATSIIDSFFTELHFGSQEDIAQHGHYKDCTHLKYSGAALSGACQSGSIEVVRLILGKMDRDHNCGYDDADSVIRAAYQVGDPAIIDLVTSKIEPDPDDMLYGACRGGCGDLIAAAIERGAGHWESGLRGACRGGHVDIARDMIGRGAIEWQDALCASSKSGNIELVHLLTEKIKFVASASATSAIIPLTYALRAACRHGRLDVARFLIEQGADPTDITEYDACRGGNLDIVKLVDSTWKSHDDCLVWAVARHWLDIVDYAIARGATSFTGGLYQACSNGSMTLTLRMLRLGARNYDAALKEAFIGRHYDLVDLMAKKCREAYESGNEHLLGIEDEAEGTGDDDDA